MTGPPRTPTAGRFAAARRTVRGHDARLMALWAVGSMLLYGHGPVVVSSAMAPALDVGDLVVVEPFHGQRLHEGSVVVFVRRRRGRPLHHPPGGDVHRDGTFTTRRGRQRGADSTPLERARIEASGRFLLRLGLPVVWRRAGGARVLTAVALLFSVWLACFALLDARDPWLAGVVRPDEPVVPLGVWCRAPPAGRAAIGEVGAPHYLAAPPVAGSRARRTGPRRGGGPRHGHRVRHSRTRPPTAANQFAAGSLAVSRLHGVRGLVRRFREHPFRSSSSASNTLGDQLTILRPTGMAAGDVMIAAPHLAPHDFGHPDRPARRVEPDPHRTRSPPITVQGLFWKVVTGSEPASYIVRQQHGGHHP